LTFISGEENFHDNDIQVQIRYRHKPINCELLSHHDGRAVLKVALANDAPTPGQAAVFYKGDEVIGGGWIE